MDQPPWSSVSLVFLGSNKGRLDDSSFPCCPGGAVLLSTSVLANHYLVRL